MEKEKIKLFPDELPSGKRYKVKRRGRPMRTRSLVSMFLCIAIFALGFAASEGIRNGTIKLPPFMNIQNGTSSTPSASDPPPSDDASGGENDSGEEVLDASKIYEFDYSLVKDGEYAVIPLDLSLSEYGHAYIYNDTEYDPNVGKLLNESFLPKFSAGDDPIVLIIHTHTSEAYTEEGKISYAEDEEYARSSDSGKNVVAVGEVIAEILNENGIKTLHCPTVHDESYKDSYSRSAKTIEYYLNKYPSIKYVFDVHRDSIIRSSGEIVRPVTVVDGEAVAQIMCVVGTDQYGEERYEWEQNLALAVALRASLNEKYVNMARGTCLRPSSYNQELSQVSLLLEIGAGGNSLSEAKAAARIVALELVTLIKGE